MSGKAIQVAYDYVDGAHFFTSTDPRAFGLCVASTDLKAAYDEVAKQLNVLLAKNTKVEHPNCQPDASFDEFLSWLLKQIDGAIAKKAKIATRPSATMDWKMEPLAA